VRKVFLALGETRKKLDTNAKDEGATTKRGFAKRWFHHVFAMLSTPRVNRLAKGMELWPQYLIQSRKSYATLVHRGNSMGPIMR
jgi:hypothetical protein